MIKVKNENVPVCETAEYLGNMLSTNDFNDIVKDGIKDFNASFNIFMSKFSTCSVLVKNKLFNQYCCYYYGSQLWPLYNKDFEDICIKWRNAIRRIWNLPYNTHCRLLPLIAEHKPVEVALAARFAKFAKSILLSNNDTVKYVANLQSQNCRSVFGHNIRHLLLKYDILLQDFQSLSIDAVKKSIFDKYYSNVKNVEFNHANMIRDLCQRHESFDEFFLTEEDSTYLLNYLCTN